MDLYKQYLNAKRDREDAERWDNLPNGPSYNKSTFSISPAHCRIPKALNRVIIDIIAEDEAIIKKAIDKLKETELECLKKCQDFVDELQEKINSEAVKEDEI